MSEVIMRIEYLVTAVLTSAASLVPAAAAELFTVQESALRRAF